MKTDDALHEVVNAAFHQLGGKGETDVRVIRGRRGYMAIEEILKFELDFADGDSARVKMPRESRVLSGVEFVDGKVLIFKIGPHGCGPFEPRVFARYALGAKIAPLKDHKRHLIGRYTDGKYWFHIFEITGY